MKMKKFRSVFIVLFMMAVFSTGCTVNHYYRRPPLSFRHAGIHAVTGYNIEYDCAHCHSHKLNKHHHHNWKYCR